MEKSEDVMLEMIIKMVRELMKPLVGEAAVEVKGGEVGKEKKKGVGDEEKKAEEKVEKRMEEESDKGLGVLLGMRVYGDVVRKQWAYDLSIGYEFLDNVSISMGVGKLKYVNIKPRIIFGTEISKDIIGYVLTGGSIIFMEEENSYGVMGGVGVRFSLMRNVGILFEVPVEYYLKIPEGLDKLRVVGTIGAQLSF